MCDAQKLSVPAVPGLVLRSVECPLSPGDFRVDAYPNSLAFVLLSHQMALGSMSVFP